MARCPCHDARRFRPSAREPDFRWSGYFSVMRRAGYHFARRRLWRSASDDDRPLIVIGGCRERKVNCSCLLQGRKWALLYRVIIAVCLVMFPKGSGRNRALDAGAWHISDVLQGINKLKETTAS